MDIEEEEEEMPVLIPCKPVWTSDDGVYAVVLATPECPVPDGATRSLTRGQVEEAIKILPTGSSGVVSRGGPITQKYCKVLVAHLKRPAFNAAGEESL
jgi:hypothetical protein